MIYVLLIVNQKVLKTFNLDTGSFTDNNSLLFFVLLLELFKCVFLHVSFFAKCAFSKKCGSESIPL